MIANVMVIYYYTALSEHTPTQMGILYEN